MLHTLTSSPNDSKRNPLDDGTSSQEVANLIQTNLQKAIKAKQEQVDKEKEELKILENKCTPEAKQYFNIHKSIFFAINMPKVVDEVQQTKLEFQQAELDAKIKYRQEVSEIDFENVANYFSKLRGSRFAVLNGQMTDEERLAFYQKFANGIRPEKDINSKKGIHLGKGPNALDSDNTTDADARKKTIVDFLQAMREKNIHNIIANGTPKDTAEHGNLNVITYQKLHDAKSISNDYRDFENYFGASEEDILKTNLHIWDQIPNTNVKRLTYKKPDGSIVQITSINYATTEHTAYYQLRIQENNQPSYHINVQQLTTPDVAPAVLEQKEVEEVFDRAIIALANPKHGLFVHCAGGRGRTGNIALAMIDALSVEFPDATEAMLGANVPVPMVDVLAAAFHKNPKELSLKKENSLTLLDIFTLALPAEIKKRLVPGTTDKSTENDLVREELLKAITDKSEAVTKSIVNALADIFLNIDTTVLEQTIQNRGLDPSEDIMLFLVRVLPAALPKTDSTILLSTIQQQSKKIALAMANILATLFEDFPKKQADPQEQSYPFATKIDGTANAGSNLSNKLRWLRDNFRQGLVQSDLQFKDAENLSKKLYQICRDRLKGCHDNNIFKQIFKQDEKHKLNFLALDARIHQALAQLSPTREAVSRLSNALIALQEELRAGPDFTKVRDIPSFFNDIETKLSQLIYTQYVSPQKIKQYTWEGILSALMVESLSVLTIFSLASLKVISGATITLILSTPPGWLIGGGILLLTLGAFIGYKIGQRAEAQAKASFDREKRTYVEYLAYSQPGTPAPTPQPSPSSNNTGLEQKGDEKTPDDELNNANHRLPTVPHSSVSLSSSNAASGLTSTNDSSLPSDNNAPEPISTSVTASTNSSLPPNVSQLLISAGMNSPSFNSSNPSAISPAPINTSLSSVPSNTTNDILERETIYVSS